MTDNPNRDPQVQDYGEPIEAIAAEMVGAAEGLHWQRLELFVEVLDPDGVVDLDFQAIEPSGTERLETPAGVCTATSRWLRMLKSRSTETPSSVHVVVNENLSFDFDLSYE